MGHNFLSHNAEITKLKSHRGEVGNLHNKPETFA